jgi:hypothetical protein
MAEHQKDYSGDLQVALARVEPPREDRSGQARQQSLRPCGHQGLEIDFPGTLSIKRR